MELTGKVVNVILTKSRNEELEDFLKECGSCFSVVLKTPPEIQPEIAAILFLQVARLSGLLHDIGHLPFSHLGEGAVEPFEDQLYATDTDWLPFKDGVLGKRPSLHEFATLKLLMEDSEIRRVFEENLVSGLDLRPLCVQVFKPECKGVFRTIQDLISNDVDVDRADYLLRDGRTSGVDYGQYDILRLVEAMRLYRDEKNFIIRPTIMALSVVEKFLLERYLLYKWLYFHNYVVLTDTSLVEVLRILIKHANESNHPFFGTLPLRKFHFSKYVYNGIPFDDIEVWNSLRLAYLKSKEPAAKEREEVRVANALLRILLHREKLAKALWKNLPAYANFDIKLREVLFSPEESKQKEVPEEPILNIYAKLHIHSRTKPGFETKLQDVLKSKESFPLVTERTDFVPFKTEHKASMH